MEEPSRLSRSSSADRRPRGEADAGREDEPNDRLIGTAQASRAYRELKALKDMSAHLLKEIEHFFVSYNEERGRDFKVLGRFGRALAARLVKAGEKRFRTSRQGRA